MVGTTIFSFFFIADESGRLLYDDFYSIFRPKKIIFCSRAHSLACPLPGRDQCFFSNSGRSAKRETPPPSWPRAGTPDRIMKFPSNNIVDQYKEQGNGGTRVGHDCA
jgi:hypothetical protein